MVSLGSGPGPERRGGPGPYTRDPEDVEWLHEFEMEPADREAVADRLAAGDVLETMDIPAYLDKPLTIEVDTGLVLYRLVLLFGTPNVGPLMAGGEQPGRDRRTWQYLFEVSYDPEGEYEDRRSEPGEWLVAVYDDGVDVSIGLARWTDGDGADLDAQLPEPDGEVPPGLEPPEEGLLIGLVQLVSAAVEEPVQATADERWV